MDLFWYGSCSLFFLLVLVLVYRVPIQSGTCTVSELGLVLVLFLFCPKFYLYLKKMSGTGTFTELGLVLVLFLFFAQLKSV